MENKVVIDVGKDVVPGEIVCNRIELLEKINCLQDEEIRLIIYLLASLQS